MYKNLAHDSDPKLNSQSRFGHRFVTRQRQNGTMYKNLGPPIRPPKFLYMVARQRQRVKKWRVKLHRFVTRQRQNGTMYKNLGPPIRPPKFLYMVARQRQRVKKWRVKLLGEPARPNSQALLGRKALER